VTPDEVFLEGGKALDRRAFRTLATLPDSGDMRWRGLARQFASTPLGRLFAERPAAAALEDRVAAALTAWQRAESRQNPLSAAAVLEVLLRIRGEAHDVRLVAFAVDLGAPRQAIEPNLVCAA
jgi:vacuolar-type H+-ATPase subunit C/Vma6